MPAFLNLLRKKDLLFSVLCGLLLTINRVHTWVYGQNTLVDLLLIGAYFFGGYYTFLEVIHSLRRGKFNIDLLMLIAAVGAAIIGAWAEGALLLFLFSLGHALEHLAMDRAKNAIRALSDLAPDTARLMAPDGITEIPAAKLKKGDRVQVRPGERFPADGFVVSGYSAVDQAPITGESIPVDKFAVDDNYIDDPDQTGKKEHRIFAGTINGDGVIEFLVTNAAEESTLGRVIKLIQEAGKHKSPTERFAASFEKKFVPAVLVFVFAISFAFLVLDEAFRDSFYRAMTVLVAASPCALAISTPSAILSGIARSAKLGILVKGGAPLENLGMVRAIAFDKTGTITMGSPVLTDVIGMNGADTEKLLSVSAAAESLFDHPLAKAIVKGSLEKLNGMPLPQASSGENIPGKGLRAVVGGKPVEIGKAALFDGLPENIAEEVKKLWQNGRTTVIVRHGGEYLGVLGLMDHPREGASDAVDRLRAMGFEQLVLLSGDHQVVADAVAAETGIGRAMGDLLPADKLTTLNSLIKEHGYVAMVGDGVNDGPALAGATVGIAMGAAGSDVALETADIALMGDDIRRLPTAIALSRETRKIIRQNIFISLGMIAFLVPAALSGLAGMGIAVLLHEGSTIAVVLNALRLLGWNDAR